jgi:hypothetical protein
MGGNRRYALQSSSIRADCTRSRTAWSLRTPVYSTTTVKFMPGWMVQ